MIDLSALTHQWGKDVHNSIRGILNIKRKCNRINVSQFADKL